MGFGTTNRSVTRLSRIVVYSLLLLGLVHCGQKGGLTRPEDTRAAFSATSATSVMPQNTPGRWA